MASELAYILINYVWSPNCIISMATSCQNDVTGTEIPDGGVGDYSKESMGQLSIPSPSPGDFGGLIFG